MLLAFVAIYRETMRQSVRRWEMGGGLRDSQWSMVDMVLRPTAPLCAVCVRGLNKGALYTVFTRLTTRKGVYQHLVETHISDTCHETCRLKNANAHLVHLAHQAAHPNPPVAPKRARKT